MNKKVIIFHLLNEYSGSPAVLSWIIKGLIGRDYEVELYTSLNSNGPLSDIPGVKYHHVYYRFSKFRLTTALFFIYAQFCYFFAVLKYKRSVNVLIYINTIYPFGATLGAALTGRKVIYHVHEYPVQQNILHKIALHILKKFADHVVLVSEYLYNIMDLAQDKKSLVYNSLLPDFMIRARKHAVNFKPPFNILMICSLRVYKGVFVFRELAAHLPQYEFYLVVNAGKDAISSFFKDYEIPGNLTILPSEIDVRKYYEKSHLLMNLSCPDMIIETFGLTVLEAFAYGIPVIVPPVGGIAELVEDGIHGYKVESGNIEMLKMRVCNILSDANLYLEMSEKVRMKSELFSYKGMIEGIEAVINKV